MFCGTALRAKENGILFSRPAQKRQCSPLESRTESEGLAGSSVYLTTNKKENKKRKDLQQNGERKGRPPSVSYLLTKEEFKNPKSRTL